MRNYAAEWIERIDEDTGYFLSGGPDPFERLRKLKTPYQPESGRIFRAFDLCHYGKVRVVIVGQDPYPTRGKATGLCFGLPAGWKKISSSFLNIKNEVESDVGGQLVDFTLESWAKQGVLLLNTILTVTPEKPLSHKKIIGWEQFTDCVMKTLNDYPEPLVFIAWGNPAKNSLKYITDQRHLILTASHPCKHSAHISFFGCKHFSKANAFLKKHKRGQIQWSKA